MKRYTTLLFDADMTLFDFEYAEKRSFGIVMAENGIQYSEAQFACYQAINSRLWAQFGRGEITKDDIQSERFTAFLRTLSDRYTREDGIRCNNRFVEGLAECAVLLDGAAELCKKLAESYELYIVTNGISRVQKSRFAKSEIRPYIKGVFVSEDAGEPKPGAKYFDYVFAHIGEDKRETSVIIGDSLESDIRGGEVAGIDSIWYNPGRKINSTGIRPTAEAADFASLYQIITNPD